jgi:hypothetical protein
MKRELLHNKCNWKVQPVTLDTDPVALAEVFVFGEDVTRVYGTARGSYMCDNCGEGIEMGEPVIALSVSTTAAPYFKWEDDYVEVAEEPKNEAT